MVDSDELVASYRGGASMRLLAERYGVSRNIVRRVLDAAGEPRRTAGHPRLPVHAEDVAELVEAGVGWEEISTRLGISPAGARARWDEIRSTRGLVRRGRWHDVLTDALSRDQIVPVLPTVTDHLGRRPTGNEARDARRAAYDLARRGEAVTSHEPMVWKGKRMPMLVLRRPEADGHPALPM